MDKVQAIVRELRKREAFPAAVKTYVSRLFPQQAALLASPAKRKLTHTGRRGGKTHVLIAMALQAADRYPGETIPVIQRTLSCQAAEAFWRELQTLDGEFKLGLKFQHTLRIATCPNGSKIALQGADTAEAADKIRGGRFPLVIIDEAGTFRPHILEYLVVECAEPATMDFDGTIVLAGTPNPVKRGYFYDASVSGQWDVHHWTSVDNVSLPRTGALANASAEERRAWRIQWLAELRARNSWPETHSKYVREYLGQWTDTTHDVVYELDGTRNCVSHLPVPVSDSGWTWFLGIDCGFNDPSAFSVWGRRPGDPNLYLAESYEQTKLIPSAMAGHVERLDATYHFARMVCDTGGLGVAYAKEMSQTYGLRIEAANKQGKVANIEYLNGDLRSGRIKIVRSTNQDLLEDLQLLRWNDAGTDVADDEDDHIPDSMLYGHRAARMWLPEDQGDRDGHEPGTEEWWREREAEIESAMEAAYLRGTQPQDDSGYGDGDAWLD